jgi:hypothetical protein
LAVAEARRARKNWILTREVQFGQKAAVDTSKVEVGKPTDVEEYPSDPEAQ